MNSNNEIHKEVKYNNENEVKNIILKWRKNNELK